MLRKTKIVCTIGPASSSRRVISRMVKEGMNTARLNCSHGTHRGHLQAIKTIREEAAASRTPVAVLLDLPGPKLRTGKLEEEGVVLKAGERFTFTAARTPGNRRHVSVDSPEFFSSLKSGDNIYLNDGALQLEVENVEEGEVRCRVIVGGRLTENRGINVPSVKLHESPVSPEDRKHIAFGIRHGVDFFAISLVHSAEDVAAAKRAVRELGGDTPLIAKIEKQDAVNDIDNIIAAADGVMVARGDLGVEIQLEKVPVIQKEIIRKCNAAGKPVIVATQMLESMVESNRPTRAEVSDVANAIFDGTDAVMLSGETAIGRDPVQVLKVMARIAVESEKSLPYDRMLAEKSDQVTSQMDDAISYSASVISRRLKAACIVAYTTSGATAVRVSRYRPEAPIVAITPNPVTARKLALNWGIEPHLVTEPINADQMFEAAARIARNTSLAREGDRIIITAGIPMGIPGSTNVIKVQLV